MMEATGRSLFMSMFQLFACYGAVAVGCLTWCSTGLRD